VSKATVYLDDDLHRALRLKSAETRESMSELVNEALRVLLAEDLQDLSDWHERRSERPVGYEEFLKQLEADGTI
jgi:plasmid stability protein